MARELCQGLQGLGHQVQIFTGFMRNSIPENDDMFSQKHTLVKPLSQRFLTSSLWSNRLPKDLLKLIRSADIVHIHFAREIIPIITAFMCILLKKPYITQTHGMVIKDPRLASIVIDRLFVRFALRHSRVNLALHEHELSQIIEMDSGCKNFILPNGITIQKLPKKRPKNDPLRIVFCSRIQKRKRPDRFLSLARYAYEHEIKAEFIIYGPDGGQLPELLTEIENEPKLQNVVYKGPLMPNKVLQALASTDLLVLPSENEPFPMIVLESLSVGTPVLIMPSCQIAELIRITFPKLVANKDTTEALFPKFRDLVESQTTEADRAALIDFCRNTFNQSEVIAQLNLIYQSEISEFLGHYK